jgi:hypothetical protein
VRISPAHTLVAVSRIAGPIAESRLGRAMEIENTNLFGTQTAVDRSCLLDRTNGFGATYELAQLVDILATIDR